MKYNDKSANMWRQREVNKDETDRSTRSYRREMERSMKSFTLKVYKFVEREWWDSFTTEERMSIYHSWSWMSKRFYTAESSFGDWIKNTRSDKMPDISIYRDNKIKNLTNGI